MAGISLGNYGKRLSCPHCGSDDCAAIDGGKSICIITGKVITDEELVKMIPGYEPDDEFPECYTEGFIAAVCGQSEDDNPYKPSGHERDTTYQDEMHYQWYSGHVAGGDVLTVGVNADQNPPREVSTA